MVGDADAGVATLGDRRGHGVAIELEGDEADVLETNGARIVGELHVVVESGARDAEDAQAVGREHRDVRVEPCARTSSSAPRVGNRFGRAFRGKHRRPVVMAPRVRDGEARGRERILAREQRRVARGSKCPVSVFYLVRLHLGLSWQRIARRAISSGCSPAS